MTLFLAYLAFTTLLVLTPGSATAVVVRNALAGGRRAGLSAAAGVATANTTHAVLAGMGLWVLLGRWPLVLDFVRAAGAVYLAWLGAKSLARAWRHADGGLRLVTAAAAHTGDHRPSFVEGLTVNLLNPAIITFYLAVVPTFIPPAPPPGYFTLLAAVHIGLALSVHSTWVVALGALRRFFAHPVAGRTLEALTGVALVWLAARVLGRL